jgi:hypothetical protein
MLIFQTMLVYCLILSLQLSSCFQILSSSPLQSRLVTNLKVSLDDVNIGGNIFIEEKFLGSKESNKIIVLKEQNKTFITFPNQSKFKLIDFAALFVLFKSVFLPDGKLQAFLLIHDMITMSFIARIGYPTSVPKEYSRFQAFNLLQDSCSYLRGILSTRAMLEGFGVGRNDITAVQAAVQWILRDGAAMIGGLLFTSFSSANFGQNVKSWRLFADLINNIGITLDMLAPIFRHQFLVLVCLASICKSLCGIAAGATGAAIAEHWGGERGNIADVLAKNGAQHTLINLIGLSVSIPFANFANADIKRLFSIYGILTALHIFSNYQAMKTLALRSLNIVRYRMLVSGVVNHELLRSMDRKKAVVTMMNTSKRFSLEDIAKAEPLFTLIIPRIFRLDLLIGRIIQSFTPAAVSDDCIKLWSTPSQAIKDGVANTVFKLCLGAYKPHYYALLPYLKGRSVHVNVCFRDGCSAINIAKGIMESYLLQSITQTAFLNSNTTTTSTAKLEDVLLESIAASRMLCDEIFPVFWDQLTSVGWDTKRVLLTTRNPLVFQYITEQRR